MKNQVYKDYYGKDSSREIEDLEFRKSKTSDNEKITESNESIEKEGETIALGDKRKRGRPRETPDKALIVYQIPEFEESLTTEDSTESEDRERDMAYHALLAKIQGDPQAYREAINSHDGVNWRNAIESELNSIKEKGIFVVVEREKIKAQKAAQNILDSRWIFKKKVDETGNVKFKARLVVRGFKDKNKYDLRETYAPVSRLPLVRSFVAIANKYELYLRQLNAVLRPSILKTSTHLSICLTKIKRNN